METKTETKRKKAMEKNILNKLEEMQLQLRKLQFNSNVFLDNQEFLQIMNISKRTAQQWRDSGIISYSQIGAKIYYRFSDIEELLNKNYVVAKQKHNKRKNGE